MAPAMFQNSGKPRGNGSRKACPGAYNKLDQASLRFGHACTKSARAINRRRAMGVGRLDRLQPPDLAILALSLGPDDRLPVPRQDEADAGVDDLDAAAAGLPTLEKTVSAPSWRSYFNV
jgi:hypothetical protein